MAQHLKREIIDAAGPLQLAAGQQGGVEAATHAMGDIFHHDESQAMLMADAKNAFNSLNRKAALINMRYLCPALAIFAINFYRTPAKLFLANGSYILSSEGTTQGCNIAMPFYCISIRPMINQLASCPVSQVFYADDGSAVGRLDGLRQWWDRLMICGPGYGYYPRADKSWLVVKDEHREEAERIFSGSGVRITTEGHRYLGAPLGTRDFMDTFVTEKVEEWVSDINALADIALTEPQACYSAFCIGLSKRWLFLMRTTKGVAHLFSPLEEAISNKLLPVLTGTHMSEFLRKLVRLPARNGGMGVENPTLQADAEYERSRIATLPLKQLLIEQKTSIDSSRGEQVENELREARGQITSQKRNAAKAMMEEVRQEMTPDQQRLHDEHCKRGASTWLTSLPLSDHGFTLNKQEFRDSLALRYSLPIQGMPNRCACGQINGIEHCLTCPKGGYVHMRHNQIRDLTANLLEEAGCKDVTTEPRLLPITGEEFDHKTTITANDARLDVAALGVWNPMEKCFLDIRIFNSRAPTNMSKPIETTMRRHEEEKKRNYNDRVIQVEKATFTPVVFSTSGALGDEADRLYKKIAKDISRKNKNTYADTIRYIRQRLAFCLLKTVIISLRGYRGKRPCRVDDTVDYNLLYL